MKISIKGLAITMSFVWGMALLIIGSMNMIYPDYGTALLEVVGSMYPGYQPGTGFSSVIIGSLYGAIDGGIGGAIIGWIYNFCTEKCCQ